MKMIIERIVGEFNKIFNGSKRVGDSLRLEGRRMSALDVNNAAKLGYKSESELSVKKSVLADKSGLLQSFNSNGDARVNANGDPVYIKENQLSVLNAQQLNGVLPINLEVDISKKLRYSDSVVLSVSNLIWNPNTYTVVDSYKLGGKLENDLVVKRAVDADNADKLNGKLQSQLVVEKSRIATKLFAADGITERLETDLQVYSSTTIKHAGVFFDMPALRDWLITQATVKAMYMDKVASSDTITTGSGNKSFSDIISYIKSDSSVEAYKATRLVTSDNSMPNKTGDQLKEWIISHNDLKNKVAELTSAIAVRATTFGSSTDYVDINGMDNRIKATVVNNATNSGTLGGQTLENIFATVRTRILSDSTNNTYGLTQPEVDGFFGNNKVKIAITSIKVNNATNSDTLTNGGSTINLSGIYQAIKDTGDVKSSKYIYADPNNAGSGLKSFGDITSLISTGDADIKGTATTNFNTLGKIEGIIGTNKTNIENALNTEITNRTNADTTLQNNINTEKARIDAILSASAADKDSFAEIVTLINSVDTTNDTAFASYVTSNNAAVSALDTAYKAANTALIGTATTNYNTLGKIEGVIGTNKTNIESALNTEITNRTSADTTLQNNINTEKSRIDAILNGADNDKNSFSEIKTYVDGLTGSLATATTSLSGNTTKNLVNIANDIESRVASLETAGSSTPSKNDVDKIKVAVGLKNDGTLPTITGKNYVNSSTSLLNAIYALDTALNTETTNRTSEDTTLQNNINTEKARIDAILSASAADKDSFAEIVTLINSVDTSNDNAFAGYVTSNNAAVSALETAYKSADATLTTSIESEVTARQNAITSLTSTVTGIETSYKAADTTLQGNIDSEVTARQNAITSLTATVTGIETSYKAADATLTTSIESEVTARQNATGTLTNLKTTASNNLVSAINENTDSISTILSHYSNEGSITANAVTINATTRVAISGAPFRLPLFDNAGRDGLSANDGDIIYNTEAAKFQGYQNGGWINLDGTSIA